METMVAIPRIVHSVEIISPTLHPRYGLATTLAHAIRSALIAVLVVVFGGSSVSADTDRAAGVLSAVLEIAGVIYRDSQTNREVLNEIGSVDPGEILLESFYATSVGGILQTGAGRLYITNMRVIYRAGSSGLLGLGNFDLFHREIADVRLSPFFYLGVIELEDYGTLQITDRSGRDYKFILNDSFFSFGLGRDDIEHLVAVIEALR